MPITNQIEIGYKTDSAIIYFGQTDAIELTEELLETNRFSPGINREIINDLEKNLSYLKNVTNGEVILCWQNQKESIDYNKYEFAGLIDQFIIRDLLLKGKIEVLRLANNQYQKEIIYHYLKDKLGGIQCYYTFKNGNEFYRYIIALGE